jgi:cyclophilin family peptidyl-prolyl cis-trans isomerase
VWRLAERPSKLPAEMSAGELGCTGEVVHAQGLEVARVGEVLRSQEVAGKRDECHRGQYAGPRSSLDEVQSKPATVRPMTQATLHTNHGAIALELFDEDAPKTVENFVKLSKDGFYDGTTFHRVIPDFMIQGGCPRGDGTGGPGYEFEDEPNDHGIVRGALAMANRGPDTNGSQFFIVTTEAAPWLDGKHTVFGRVSEGMDVVDEISDVPRDSGDRPGEPITIDRVELS